MLKKIFILMRFYITFFGRKIGLTLTELLIVVIIIGILATLAIPMLTKTIEKAKVGEAISNLNLIRTGQKIYFLEYGNFTTDITSLNIENPNTNYAYFNYTVTSTNSTDFTAVADRKDDAPAGYEDDQYIIHKDGRITGPLL